MIFSPTGKNSLDISLRSNSSTMRHYGSGDAFRIPSLRDYMRKSQYLFVCLLISLCISSCWGNEHDSLACEESGTCEESIHTVIKLAKRDDELARRLARSYGLEVKVGLYRGIGMF